MANLELINENISIWTAEENEGDYVPFDGTDPLAELMGWDF